MSASCERDEVHRPELAPETGERDHEHHRARHDVDRLPYLDLANADEHLRVHRLGEGVVELSVADLVHQPEHVGLHEGPNEPAHEDLDAEKSEQLRLGPSVELSGIRVHQPEHDETGDNGEQRLKHLKRKVDAVLELIHHADAEMQKRHANGVHPATAEYRRIAFRQAREKIRMPTQIQNTCIASPTSSS